MAKEAGLMRTKALALMYEDAHAPMSMARQAMVAKVALARKVATMAEAPP